MKPKGMEIAVKLTVDFETACNAADILSMWLNGDPKRHIDAICFENGKWRIDVSEAEEQEG